MSILLDEEASQLLEGKDIIDEEKIAKLEDKEEEQSKKNKKLKRKISNRNILILILIIIIIILLLRSCSSGGNLLTRLPDLENAEYVQSNETPAKEHIEGMTGVPVISDFTVSKSNPYKTLYNPESNSGYSYLQYSFTNSDTNKVIYESKLVEPGQKFSVAFGDMLEVGTYNVSVDIHSFDYSDPSIEKNGTHNDIVVTVTE